MLCGNNSTFKADSVTLGTNRQLLLAQIVGYIPQARSTPRDLMGRDLDLKDTEVSSIFALMAPRASRSQSIRQSGAQASATSCNQCSRSGKIGRAGWPSVAQIGSVAR